MSSKGIRRNTVFNIIGAVAPMILALATVPIFLKYIGAERFGVLSLVWLLVGYFGVFDFGLSRTTANQIAKLHGSPQEVRESVFWTAIWLNVALGVLGGVLLYLVATPLISTYFEISGTLRSEILSSLIWVAISVPVATLTGVILGALEGIERFALANSIQVIGTAMVQLAPLLAYWLFGSSLEYLVPSIVLARAISGGFLFLAVIKTLPICRPRWIDKKIMPELMTYGAWISVSSFISPMLESFDRIFIGMMVGAKSVAYYSVPFNIVDKLRVFPRAIGRAIFPRLSQNGKTDARQLTIQSIDTMIYLMTGAIAPFIPLVGTLMSLWVGAEFSSHSILVAHILLIGIWANSPAVAPLLYLQSQGRPDLVAKLHLAEFLPFLGILWLGIKWFGIEGAAMAWTLRVLADALLLYWQAGVLKDSFRKLFIGLLIVCSSFGFSAFGFPNIYLTLACSLMMSGVVLLWVWKSDPVMIRQAAGILNKRFRN
jgi:O-antigen/teichoic acid export membrane protein